MNTFWDHVINFFRDKFPDMLDKLFNYAENVAMDIGISLLYIIVGLVIIKVGQKVIRKIFHLSNESDRIPMSERKARTLSAVVESVWQYVIYFIIIMAILDRFGINTKSILAVAGVGGVAIGFGAQALVKDVITGFFILLEDQYGVGEMITVNAVSGTVEEIGLRVTKIKDATGVLHFIPNSMVGIVSNHSRGYQKAILDVNVAYTNDIDAVMDLIREWLVVFSEEHEEIQGQAELLGVQTMTATEIVLRIVADCQPGTQYSIVRQLNQYIKRKFDENEIQIPSQRIIYRDTPTK